MAFPNSTFQKRVFYSTLALACCLLAVFCSKKWSAHDQDMAKILADLHVRMSTPNNGYCSEARIIFTDSLMRTSSNPAQKLLYAFHLGNSLVENGEEQKAVDTYEGILKIAADDSEGLDQVRAQLGVAYIRLAERINCLNNHSGDACIMPIQGKGIHQEKSPARKAIAVFEDLLKKNPKNMANVWMLNIAYMTVGEYPAKVPKQWLVPGLDKPTSIATKPFEDVAMYLGLATNNRAGGSIVDDFDNDGYLDIVTSAWGLDDPMHFLRNNGDGTFTDRSKESGLSKIVGGLNCNHTDYNNDGWLDILVLRGAWQGQMGIGKQPNSLLRNNGDGTFSDVTIEAGLLAYHPTQTAQWADFNRDGWLDLVVGNESTSIEPDSSELYINNQDGTFTNFAGVASGFALSTFVKGLAVGDYDNDGWPDIFISALTDKHMLFRNKGVPGKIPTFENVSQRAGFASADAKQTFPACFFDFDNDGWLDIFACNYTFTEPLSSYSAREAIQPSDRMDGKPYFWRNNRDGTFTDVTKAMGANQTCFTMGMNFGDIDNDGWLDLYLGTGNPNFQSLVPNRLYKNMGGKKFVEITVGARVGNLQKGHGVSFADLDNDGDQDIHIEMGGAYRGDVFPNALYLNPRQTENNWINLKLEGKTSNRAAIGAKVALRFRDGGVERTYVREVNSGGSFGDSPFRRELGIGAATVVDEISITWTCSGEKQVFRNVQANQFLKIQEGKADFEVLKLNTLDLKKGTIGAMPMCKPAT